MRVLVLNGPNLNLLGTREPDVYGDTTLADLERAVGRWGEKLGVETTFAQSNHEGEVVDAIHGANGIDAIVINPGALTHTSRSIGDAIAAVGLPAVEVHISNIREREPWRATSLVAPSCVRSIYGRGVGGYQDALRHLKNRASMPFKTERYGPIRTMWPMSDGHRLTRWVWRSWLMAGSGGRNTSGTAPRRLRWI
jgi:3-dehydroquinate dehydratase-2